MSAALACEKYAAQKPGDPFLPWRSRVFTRPRTTSKSAWNRPYIAVANTQQRRASFGTLRYPPGTRPSRHRSAPAAVWMWAVTGWPPGPQPAPTGTSEAYSALSGDLSCSQFVWPSAVRGAREMARRDAPLSWSHFRGEGKVRAGLLSDGIPGAIFALGRSACNGFPISCPDLLSQFSRRLPRAYVALRSRIRRSPRCSSRWGYVRNADRPAVIDRIAQEGMRFCLKRVSDLVCRCRLGVEPATDRPSGQSSAFGLSSRHSRASAGAQMPRSPPQTQTRCPSCRHGCPSEW